MRSREYVIYQEKHVARVYMSAMNDVFNRQKLGRNLTILIVYIESLPLLIWRHARTTSGQSSEEHVTLLHKTHLIGANCLTRDHLT